MPTEDTPSASNQTKPEEAEHSTQITSIAKFLDEVIPNAATVGVFDLAYPDDDGFNVSRADVESTIASFDDPYLYLDNDRGELMTVALKGHPDSTVIDTSIWMTGPDKDVICVYYLADPIHLDQLPEGEFIDALPFPGARWTAEFGGEHRSHRIEGRQIVVVEDETDIVGLEEDSKATPERLNDAIVLGEDCPEFEAAMTAEATFLFGKVWPDKPHKSTQDGQWVGYTATMASMVKGHAGAPNAPAFGLSRHPVGKQKDGPCMVLGSSIGGSRKANAMDTMYAIGLDIDSGASVDYVRERILDLGYAASLYTSWNHGKQGMSLKRDDVLRKLEIKGDPTEEQVRDYLRHHGKNRFEENFIQKVTISDAKRQEKDGVKIILDTPLIDKFRVIFFLDAPVKLIDLAETQAEALSIWEDTITGLAQKVLGVHFDTSCTDPSRLFFTSRHDKSSKDWQCYLLKGKPLTFAEIPRMKKSQYTRNRDLNPFVEADDQRGGEVPEVTLPSGKSLNKWHSRKGKQRFQIADLLEIHCSERIRVSGGEKAGSVHTECPFEHQHSQEGGTATMAINALDGTNGFWTWFCKHDACQDRHKLEFIGEAIAQGWFDESLLFDDAFLLPPEDDPEDEDEAQDATQPRSPLEQAQKITAASSDEEVKKLIKRLVRRNAGEMDKENVISDIAKRTPLGKRALTSWWREISNEHRAKEDFSADDNTVKNVTSDLPDLVAHARAGIFAANEREPQLFHFVDAPAYIRCNAAGNIQIEAVTSKDKMKAQINKVAKFGRKKDDKGNMQIVDVPDAAANMVLYDDLTFLPPLKSVTGTPFFAADGTLIATDGYHRDSATLLRLPDGFEMPQVPPEPSEEDVREAKRLLVEDVAGDFPLSGVSREALVSEGRGEASMTEVEAAGLSHLIGAMLLPFVRNMIDGPTPGHLINKPAPGTGASLLVDTLSIITSGAPTPTKTLPSNKEEVSKTLTSVLMAGSPIVFFDNINHEMDTGELASAMTAPTFSARILGGNTMVETEVRCMWIFTGNKVTMSHELTRRNVLIPLDAGLDPTKRTAWRHRDLRGWVRQNRGRLVWACLILIQNWIARGKRLADKELASYDRWSATMGGIIRDAGLRGFLANEKLLHGSVKKEQEEGVGDLLDLIANLPDGAILRLGGWTRPKAVVEDAPVVSILHLLNRDIADNGSLPPELHATQGQGPIVIPRWGCHPVDEVYKTANKIGPEWRALADRPQQGYDDEAQEMVSLRFEERKDERMKAYWILRKDRGPDDGAGSVGR